MTTNKAVDAQSEFDRDRLRSDLFSLFWAVISDRKKRGKYTLKEVAIATKRDKSAVSRWFASPPNWQLNTVADIASALDLDLEFRARERSTGRVYCGSGLVKSKELKQAPATPVSGSQPLRPIVIGMAAIGRTSDASKRRTSA